MLVLLDRDGVINRDAPAGILRLTEFQFLPRALEGIAMMTKAGFRIAICTNQSAVGRGNMSQETLDTIHQYLCEQVTQSGGRIDKIYAATDHPDASTIRRKPGPGMLLEALTEFSAEASRTPMVGDALRDIEAAATAGCPRILTRTGNGAKLVASGVPNHVLPLTICDDLFHAAQHICEHYR